MKKLLAAAVLVLGVMAVARPVLAAVTPNGTVHACARITSGALRIVEEGEACRLVEYPVSWGPTQTQIVAGSLLTDPSTMDGHQTAEAVFCPEGMVATGGTAWIDRGWGETYALPVKLVDDERGIPRQWAVVDWYSWAFTGDSLEVTYNITCG